MRYKDINTNNPLASWLKNQNKRRRRRTQAMKHGRLQEEDSQTEKKSPDPRRKKSEAK
uniref:Uncharacterized protein n=1 Tax=Kalanchoe fedtschenkoi TaxID=63787 RepID=A0A7N0TD17_KALFE